MEPPPIRELFISSLAGARLLGRRTAEMHLALANATDDGLGTEPYSTLDQRSNYQSKRNLTGKCCGSSGSAPAALGEAGRAVPLPAHARGSALQALRAAAGAAPHGAALPHPRNYHLGKLLYTGKDFVVLDFEGDSTRPLAERRRKRSALRDVAAMVRSFEYAAQIALRDAAIVRETDRISAGALAARLWSDPGGFSSGAWMEAPAIASSQPRERAETAVRSVSRTMAASRQRDLRRVLERPDHGGDVAQRAPLAAALGQRTGRVAFEVQHHEVLARVEQLAQVVVPVDAAAAAP